MSHERVDDTTLSQLRHRIRTSGLRGSSVSWDHLNFADARLCALRNAVHELAYCMSIVNSKSVVVEEHISGLWRISKALRHTLTAAELLDRPLCKG